MPRKVVPATPAEIQAVLGSLSSLRIWGDWTSSSDHDLLDNVALTAVPEPAAAGIAIVAGGLGMLLAMRRRRRAASAAAHPIANSF